MSLSAISQAIGNKVQIEAKQSILMVCVHFHPEIIGAGKYNTFLAQKLFEFGYNVDVIALHPFYPQWKSKNADAKLDGVKIFRGGKIKKFSKNMILRRAQLELRFFEHVLCKIFRMHSYDNVISVFPPVLYFLFPWRIILKKTKIVGIVHDIQGVMANLSHGILKKAIINFVSKMEIKAYRKCDKVIFLSNSMAKIGKDKYHLDPVKIRVCYPFVTLKSSTGKERLRTEFKAGKFHVVYSGALGEKQNPLGILDIYQKVVEKRNDICCHFFSDSPIMDSIRKVSSSKNIMFHRLVPEGNLFEMYQKSHLHVIPQRPGVSDGAIPSKLPNLLYSGVPIFCICDPGSDLSDIVKKSGIGHCSYHWDTDKLRDELIEFLEKSNKKSNTERALIVSEFVKDKFDIARLVGEIIE